jgi:hypothetical protein
VSSDTGSTTAPAGDTSSGSMSGSSSGGSR